MNKTQKETPEQEMKRIIYERVLDLLKKQEKEDFNFATMPAFIIGLDADMGELINIGRTQAISEFKEKLIKRLWKHDKCFEGNKCKTSLALDFVEDVIDKTAQEITK